MEKTKTSKIPGFDQRVSYRIKIQGELDQSWAERFYGMSIEVQNGEENVYISTLTGSLPDQAALSGLFNTLYDMHFTILSVEMMREDGEELK